MASQSEKASPCIPILWKNNEGDEPLERFVEKILEKNEPSFIQVEKYKIHWVESMRKYEENTSNERQCTMDLKLGKFRDISPFLGQCSCWPLFAVVEGEQVILNWLLFSFFFIEKNENNRKN